MLRIFLFFIFISIFFILPLSAKTDSDTIKNSPDSSDIILLNMKENILNHDSLLSERPEEIYEEVNFVPKLSVLHIPIEINVPLLEKKLNENFNGLLYEDNNIEDDSIMIKAWKERDFKISYENNELFYQIPIKVWIKKRFNLGFTYTDREIEASIDLHLRTSIGLSKNWKLITQTSITEYSWIKKPIMKIGFLDIPITVFVDKIIENNKIFIHKKIDETVKQYVPLQAYAQQIWENIQDPIDISTNGYKAWIKTTPKKIYTTPIIGNQGKISTTFGVQCLMEIYMGEIPSKIKKEKELPKFQMLSKTDENFKINLLADIPFYVIDSIAKNKMKGETFGENKRSVTVDSIEIFGQNEKLVIGVIVKGFINGTIYLKGVPYYDSYSTSIRIKDIDYELETKNFFAKMANLFYKKSLKRKIEEELVLSLKDQFYLVKEMSRSELFNLELIENVKLNGFLEELNIESIHLTSTGLKIRMSFLGKLRVRVE